MSTTLYSAGDCPVCSFSGELLFVKDPVSDRIFVYCPLCGCSWREPPPPYTLDSIEGIEVYAPDGITLPTKEEIVHAGFARAIEREPDYDEWQAILRHVLA